MNTVAQLQQKLVRANDRCQIGVITQAAYKIIEREVVRELKEYHRAAYISGIRLGAAKR